MKWVRRVLGVLAVLALGLVAGALWTAQRPSRPVGFTAVGVADADGRTFPVGVWYPTAARTWPTTLLGLALMDVARDAPVEGSGLPLVVISHGNGGGPGSHADLALALASAGHVVAAPMHPGDNFTDQSGVGAATVFSDRARQLGATVDFLLERWEGRARLDPSRVGAFGFSAGGLTVLAAVGARPDLGAIAPHCARAPEFACDVLRQAGSPLLAAAALPPPAQAFRHDPRIRAAVVAAPGLGFTLGADGLAGVRVPVQLWSGERDTHIPYETNTRVVREGLGARAEPVSVPGAGHFSFLTPCGLLAPPALCSEADGFDRAAFHAQMNARVVAFFAERLGR
jgi:predicted dienelactone hydrolase